MADAITPTLGAEDARALDLLKTSGVLNPNLTLDRLMDVTRQIAELEPDPAATNGSGVNGDAFATFAGSFYVYKYVWR
jgi:hypothetical protein